MILIFCCILYLVIGISLTVFTASSASNKNADSIRVGSTAIFFTLFWWVILLIWMVSLVLELIGDLIKKKYP